MGTGAFIDFPRFYPLYDDGLDSSFFRIHGMTVAGIPAG